MISDKEWLENLRVMIAIPSQSSWAAGFGMCLAQSVGYFEGMPPPFPETKHKSCFISNTRGAQISYLREKLVLTAVEGNATHLLFLDSDMTFPRDTIERLLKHRKPFVAAQGVTKRIPAEPVALGFDGNKVFSNPPATGLERVEHVGLAVALLDLRVLMHPDCEPPLFEQPWSPEHFAYAGEDVNFCRVLKRLGYDIWIDHDLSYEVGHIGTFEYRHEYVGDVRQVKGDSPTTEEIREAPSVAGKFGIGPERAKA